MADKILTFNGKTISGPSGTGMAIVRGPATMTIRFKFTAVRYSGIYDPSEDSWEKGTWTKISEVENEYTIWDWTYTGSNASRAFYNKFQNSNYGNGCIEIISFNCTSEITNVSGLFEDAWRLSGDKLAIYNTLSNLNIQHENCFRNCGIGTKSGAQSLTSIPAESWGGLKPAQGNGIQIGDYVWDNGIITALINIPGLRKLGFEEEYQPGDIVYYEIDGIPRYSPAAIQYMINHPEVLPSGWHIPTLAEAQSFESYSEHIGYYSVTSIVRTTGSNGFGIDVDDEGQYDSDWPVIKNDGYLSNIAQSYPTLETGPWYVETYRWNDYPSATSYLCDGGKLTFDVEYGGIIYVDNADYSTDTNHLYPVRLVRDHD